MKEKPAFEQDEFMVEVFYDLKNPYKLINVCCNGKGKFDLSMNAFTTSFFLSVSPQKIGGKESVKAKLFPHVDGEVDFPTGWRPANIVEFVYACEQQEGFASYRNDFLVGIIGQKKIGRDGWAIPMIVLRDRLKSSGKFTLQNEILATGLNGETKYVFTVPVYFLGVLDPENSQPKRRCDFQVKIADQNFNFDKNSAVMVDGLDIEIIEPDFDDASREKKFDFYRREIFLPKFIERRINEVSLPYTRIYFDKEGRKKLIAFFD